MLATAVYYYHHRSLPQPKAFGRVSYLVRLLALQYHVRWDFLSEKDLSPKSWGLQPGEPSSPGLPDNGLQLK